MQIEEDRVLVNWLNQVCSSKTNNTRELYITVMKKYCRMVGFTPTMLIEQCEKESSLPYSKQSLPVHIGAFKNLLRESMSRSSRITYLAAVSSFYATNNIALPKKLLKRDTTPSISIENDLSLKDENVSEAIKVSELLMRTVIGIQYTSGISMSDVLALKAGTIAKNLTEDSITCLTMERQKTGIKFHTFISPTVTEWCIAQISAMQLEDNDFLICTKKGVQMKENEFLGMYRNVAEQIGLKKPEFRGYNKFHSHNMRKMFYNTILNVGGWEMSELAEYFMGHRIPATRAAYFKATPEKLKEEYKKFVPHFESVLNAGKKEVNDGSGNTVI